MECNLGFPTSPILSTSTFREICGEWGTQRYFDNNRLGVSPLIHIFSSNYLEVTIIFPIFATDSGSPQGRTSQSLVEKGRLQTLSSTCRSRKSKLRRERNRNVHIGCIVPYSLIWIASIYLGVGYRVAYPEQGNARARTWDKRSRAPTSFRR